MKDVILILLAVVLTACGPSETPKQANIPTVEELASDPERLTRIFHVCSQRPAQRGIAARI